MSFLSENPSLKWLRVKKCPACNGEKQSYHKLILRDSYSFAGEDIPFPKSGIAVVKCVDCSLVYKTVIPSPALLANVFTRHAKKIWNNPYDFKAEVQIIENLFPDRVFDLLDIGSSDGGFLKACAQTNGRRSGLDVIKYPGLDQALRGEFIKGLIDNSNLDWSGQQYDVVTMFDVLEHLYEPQSTFKNLAMLVKGGGYVVIETGNIESYIPKRVGANEWWYVHLFEHHIFWSIRSLEKAASRHGFRTIIQKSKRHKLLGQQPFKAHALNTFRLALYAMNTKLYKRIALKLGKKAVPPWNTALKDHIFVVLQKSI